MKKILSLTSLLLCSAFAALAEQTIPASSKESVTVVGRYATDADKISFDWSGVQLRIRFKGTRLEMKASDTKANWFNVWVDKTPGAREDFKIRTSSDSTYVIVSGLKKGEHTVVLQKRTEGEQGIVSIENFRTDGVFLTAPAMAARKIEFIGDSYTCGYGTESASRDDPFSPDTENCNLTYAEIAGRYFGAEAVHISHSGCGVVRNYDSFKSPTMTERYGQVFDTNPEAKWDFAKYTPDIVVIYLGTNDFSTGMQPSYEAWKSNLDSMIGQVREAYTASVPVLVVASNASPDLAKYVEKSVAGLENVHWTAVQTDAHNRESDLGASWHPNYQGQRKVASIMIPYISTLTGWEMPFKAYE